MIPQAIFWRLSAGSSIIGIRFSAHITSSARLSPRGWPRQFLPDCPINIRLVSFTHLLYLGRLSGTTHFSVPFSRHRLSLMLLTITCTHVPATDLGYLLHKHPGRTQTFGLNFGKAHVFYPEVAEDRCTAALLLDIDPITLIRGRRSAAGRNFALHHYVNDRPYVASSFLSVAIAEVFSTALNGRSKDRQELAEQPLPFIARISALPSKGGIDLLHKLFAPLGYQLDVVQLPLDEQFPEWGESRYYTVELRADVRLQDLLAHLYVLIPVLDNEKHYWVGDDEVEKLLRHGGSWLQSHPEQQLIARRYLRHRPSLVQTLLARIERDEEQDTEERKERSDQEEKQAERKIGLHTQRLERVVEELKRSNASRVLDIGCGEGKLLALLAKERQFTTILGMDVANIPLEIISKKLAKAPQHVRDRMSVIQGSLLYRDSRLAGYDAAAIVEVIEHLEHDRLKSFERSVFEFARPGTVILTTPNREYNVMWPSLPAGKFRHRDHRFEWTRAEFEAWASDVAGRHGYEVRFAPVGPEEPELGAPTQMGIFTRG